MNSEITDVVERLRDLRSVPWLRVLDAARLDEPADDEPDPGTVVDPYAWFLGRLGEGVRLTQAGYLPPAFVSEVMTTLGWSEDWIGKQNREDQTLPVLELREAVQRLGLVRKNRGQLLVTKLGRRLADDPLRLWWRLAEGLPFGRGKPEREAGILYLLTVAAGRRMEDALLADGMSTLGWAEGPGEPVSPIGAFRAALDTWSAFRWLSLLPVAPHGDDPPGPRTDAAIRLARAALLGPTESSPAEPSSVPTGELSVRAGQPMVQLRVVLRDIEPVIWRRLLVPASLTLRELHAVIQTGLGWQDYHLHLFDVAGALYGDVEEVDADSVGDEEVFTVGAAADRVREFGYEYDFGDSWNHVIEIEQTLAGVGADTPHLIDGARACPPEDCGGPWGYQHLLEVLADPSDPEHTDLKDWVGGEFDAETFDLAGTNELLELYDRQTRQSRSRR